MEESKLPLACAKILTITKNAERLNQYTLRCTNGSLANFEYATLITANRFTYKPPNEASAFSISLHTSFLLLKARTMKVTYMPNAANIVVYTVV